MFKERTPKWILAGGFSLTAVAGCINAVGFLGYHHRPISHLTGTLTQFGTDVVRGESELAFRTGALIVSFFLGAMVSAMILRHTGLRAGRRYGVVLMLQAIVLSLAYAALQGAYWWGEDLAAAACGLQNAMATSYSGAVIRSTHMTGIITDLAIALGHWLRSQSVDRFRLRLYGVLLSGFTLGSIGGTWGFLHFGYRVLWVPAGLNGVTGLLYTWHQHRQRRQRQAQASLTPST